MKIHLIPLFIIASFVITDMGIAYHRNTDPVSFEYSQVTDTLYVQEMLLHHVVGRYQYWHVIIDSKPYSVEYFANWRGMPSFIRTTDLRTEIMLDCFEMRFILNSMKNKFPYTHSNFTCK